MYKLIVFTKDGRDIHHIVTADKLDDMIISAIWVSNFDHMSIFEIVDA
jgi:hypothetical protein